MSIFNISYTDSSITDSVINDCIHGHRHAVLCQNLLINVTRFLEIEVQTIQTKIISIEIQVMEYVLTS